ncbi:MAG: transcriptional regulator NrdR [Christensenellaceae bacterium]|jgi:transcriptional repressor NrdR|nr:transcriptional regulator NrdR [Christensenellaceae bacterium]
MRCPNCGSGENKVVDSRVSDSANSIRRRRECEKCGKRFTSYETIERISLLVVKKDGSRQAFDSQKIKNGIIAATEKRAVSIKQIDAIVDRIEAKIAENFQTDQEVPSSYIGELAMEELRKIDEVAYVRYAAVYRQFKDISTFFEFVKNLEKEISDLDAAEQ